MDDPDRMETLMLHTAGLSSRDAKWLSDTVARNMARFGGWSMELGDDKGMAGRGDKPAEEPALTPEELREAGRQRALERKATRQLAGDKPLGENGEKALKAERDARKALEGELADLKKNLAAAFGAKPDGDGKAGGADLTDIQQQIADMKHENAVLALANEHSITNKDDLKILRATRDADALQTLAARLAPAAEDDASDKKPGTPRPDRSQGRGSADTKASVAAGRELYAAKHGKKSA